MSVQKGGTSQISQKVHEKSQSKGSRAANRTFFLTLGNSSSGQSTYNSGRRLASGRDPYGNSGISIEVATEQQQPVDAVANS